VALTLTTGVANFGVRQLAAAVLHYSHDNINISNQNNGSSAAHQYPADSPHLGAAQIATQEIEQFYRHCAWC